MNQDIEIMEFEEWAMNLGCPIENLPPKKILARIFSSGQALAFAKMMNRVKPRQEVKEVRDRITAQSINKINGKIVSKFSKQKLPQEMQRWMRMNKLRDRIKETIARLADTKAEYKRYAKLVKENNISKMRAKQMQEQRAAKVAILQAKLEEVEEKIEKERSIMERVEKVMPVKIGQSNANESFATTAIAAAIDELQKYYSADLETNKCESQTEAHDKLWDRLREIFKNIPNFFLWNHLFKQKDAQLMTIDAMSKMNVNKMLETTAVATGINASSFKLAIGKLYAKHIGLDIERRSFSREKDRLLNDYVVYYESFVDDLRTKYVQVNDDDIEDDFLHEYMLQYSTSCYAQAQIEFLQKSIGTLDAEIQQRNEKQQEHQLITNSLRCIYDEIESLYCQMHDDMNALTSVRGKLEHNGDLLRYLAQGKNEQPTLYGGGGRQNTTVSINSSFNTSTESVLCSTKLDCFDNTLLMRSDMVPTRPSLLMPQHLNELKIFLDIPIEKFKNQMSMENQMQLNGNPLVLTDVLDTIPKAMIEMIPNHLQTPNAALEQLQAEYNWLQKQRKLLADVIIHEKVPTVDAVKLNELRIAQKEQLTEVTDKISVICSKTTQTLNDVGRFYKFLVDNPLEKFIPKKKLFNGRTYYDYEREFSMYYKMIENNNGA